MTSRLNDLVRIISGPLDGVLRVHLAVGKQTMCECRVEERMAPYEAPQTVTKLLSDSVVRIQLVLLLHP